MFELSKMFLLCLNYWKLETPTQYRQRTQKDDGTAYKVDYTRCVDVLLLKKAGACFTCEIPVLDAGISLYNRSVCPYDSQVAVLLPCPPE